MSAIQIYLPYKKRNELYDLVMNQGYNLMVIDMEPDNFNWEFEIEWENIEQNIDNMLKNKEWVIFYKENNMDEVIEIIAVKK